MITRRFWTRHIYTAMSLIGTINNAFREIEAENLVVQQARMSVATRDELHRRGGAIWDMTHLWTAKIVIDESVPFGEIDLSPDAPITPHARWQDRDVMGY
jgi:hypothetical protein